MKKYFSELLLKAENLALNGSLEELLSFREELQRKLSWLQHERLIHFLVTFLFAVLLFMALLGLICFSKIVLLPLVLLILILLIPYIAHYYFLENTTQKLYMLVDKIEEKIKSRPC